METIENNYTSNAVEAGDSVSDGTAHFNDVVVRDMPRHISVYKLNEDGSYEVAPNVSPQFYISDSQVSKIWNPIIAMRIRTRYGPFVGVIHDVVMYVPVRLGNTFRYILGD